MMEINNSYGKPYFSQRNNCLYPARACNVTSFINALVTANWPIPAGPYQQPEDNFMAFMRSNKEIDDEWGKIDTFHRSPPNEWYTLLAMGANLWLKDFNGPKITLTWTLTVDGLKDLLDHGAAVIVSGRYRVSRGFIGHINTVVGYQDNDIGKVINFILDDPYGDYKTEFTKANGDNVIMPVADFIGLAIPLASVIKMGIIVPQYQGV